MSTFGSVSSLSSERTVLYSPIGLRVVDEFTGGVPLGRTDAFLDIQDGSGAWLPTNVRPVRSLSGAITYPGLERCTNAAGRLPRRYRVRIAAQFYRPFYPAATPGGIEFLAYPYSDANRLNDAVPPAVTTLATQDLLLAPAPAYPFPAHVPVLRGVVVDSKGIAVQDAVVSQGLRERVLTDERGAYSLPLRWVSEGVQTPIDAVDQRTGRTGTIQIRLPDALDQSQKIQIK